MATECSSSDSDVDLDSQIDRFDDFLHTPATLSFRTALSVLVRFLGLSPLVFPTNPGKHLPDSVAVKCTVAVGVAVAAVGMHVGVSGSLR